MKKSLKTIVTLSILGLTLGAALTVGGKAEVKAAKAATETTVYYAVPSDVVGTYTVKLNINRKGDGDDWAQYDMAKTSFLYDSLPVYKYTFTDLYDGVGVMQFQLYDGNNQISQQQPISSWTAADTYNGKLYKHNVAGWKTFNETDGYFYYCNKNGASSYFTNVYIYGDHTPVSWPGASMAQYKVNDVLTFDGASLFKIPLPSKGSYKVQFNTSNNDYKADNIDISIDQLAYTWENNYDGTTHWFDHSVINGRAAKLVADIEIERCSVSGVSGKLDYSICNIENSNAGDYYDRYDAMKGTDDYELVNNAYTYTYKGAWDGLPGDEHKPEEGNINYSDIMVTLGKKGGKISTSAVVVPGIFNGETQQANYTAVIILASTLALVAVGGYFLLRKARKED